MRGGKPRPCRGCGAVFEHIDPRQHFCNRDCYQKHSWKTAKKSVWSRRELLILKDLIVYKGGVAEATKVAMQMFPGKGRTTIRDAIERYELYSDTPRLPGRDKNDAPGRSNNAYYRKHGEWPESKKKDVPKPPETWPVPPKKKKPKNHRTPDSGKLTQRQKQQRNRAITQMIESQKRWGLL